MDRESESKRAREQESKRADIDSQIYKQIDTQAGRQTDRQLDRERERQRERDRQRDRQIARQKGRQVGRQVGRQIDIYTDRNQINRYIDQVTGLEQVSLLDFFFTFRRKRFYTNINCQALLIRSITKICDCVDCNHQMTYENSQFKSPRLNTK